MPLKSAERYRGPGARAAEREALASLSTDHALERRAIAWMEDPYAALGYSNTRMHSVPREEAESVQLAAINLALKRRRYEIPVLAKLADAQNISQISRLEDVAPLLFTHEIYKSYPASLLDNL